MKLAEKMAKKNSSDEIPEAGRPPKKKKRRKIIIISVICVVVIVAAIMFLKSFRSNAKSGESAITYTAATVEKRDISVTLSGSGTLQPADSYAVTTLASGEILSDSLEEGDEVEKGTVLYQIDTADAETSITSAQLSLEKAQLSYNNLLESMDDLNVMAAVAGTITELNVEAGDNVSNGQTIGTIRNNSTMSLSIPFNSADVDSFYVGETATVTLESTFETLTGTVTQTSNVVQVLTGNMLVRYVTIDVSNPGGITDSTVATATIGDAVCNAGAAFTYKSEKTITAGTSGEVVSVLVTEGDFVSKNAVLMTLDSSDLTQQLKSSQLSLEDAQNALENKQEALEDYTVTSPISGTIIAKNYKAGDNLDNNSTATLCTIYDLSYLTMDLSVDELDVSMVEVGQDVTITADAVAGKVYSGVVTKVNIEGTTSNGVTAYPVTIRIDDTEGLLPGMNVDAQIVVESVTDAVAVPVDAVVRGNMVLVKNDESGLSDEEMAQPLTVSTDTGLPEGFEYVQVTLGVNDDSYIEITGGLEEGDIIAVVSINTTTGEMTTTTPMFGGATGGMPSGEMPSDFSGSGGPPSGGGAPMGG